MKRLLVLASVISTALPMTAIAEGKMHVKEALRDSKATYQILMQVEPKLNQPTKTILCKEGLISQDVVEDGRREFQNRGTIRTDFKVKGKDLLGASLSVEANENGTFNLAARSHYWLPAQIAVGYPVDTTLVYHSALAETILSSGNVLENGKSFRESFSEKDSDLKEFKVEVNVNPILDCARRIKRG